MRTLARVAVVLAALFSLGISSPSAPVSRDRIVGAVDATQVAAVRGTANPMARAAFDQGRTDTQRMISGAITFRLSAAQQAELDQLLLDQQDRTSPNYHRWITPQAYAGRFGMTANDLAKVSSWLQSQGLQVDSISSNRTEVAFSGSVGQVEYAFRTELHNYAIRGEQHFANSMNVSLPAAFSAQVIGVRGLDDFAPKPRVVRASPRLTSSISGNHFLTPGDFATIYDVPGAFTGAGQSIAVVGQTLINTSDIDSFRTNAGLPARTSGNFQMIQAPSTGTALHCAGDETEADLDVEWPEGVAPNATIIYVYAGVGTGTCSNRPNTATVFTSLTYAITANVAPVISISYGNCEANLGSLAQTLRQLAQQANSQGQTISGPAGDSGAADCDSGPGTTKATQGLQVDIPAALPEVTGVGGAEFTTDAAGVVTGSCAAATPFWGPSCSTTSGASALIYIPETTWNDTAASIAAGQGFSATGGGASAIFGKPSWQSGTGVPADGKRDVPDVSLNGSNGHDPYLICSQDEINSTDPGPPPATSCVIGFRDSNSNFGAVGGTSAGAPTFAGIVALLNQATSSNGLGNVNPMLYKLAASNSTNHAFHDVTTGDNKVPCTAGTTNCPTGTTSIGFTAGTGYDLVTGLGSLDVANLITAWVAASPAAADFAVDGLTSTIAAPGGSGSSTITVTAMNGFTGTVALTCAPSSSTAKITCSLNPTSLDMSTGTTNNTKTSVLSIGTSADLQSPFKWQHRGTLFAATGGLFAAVLLGGAASRKRWLGLLGFFVVVCILVGVACGGGSGSGGGGGGGGGGTGTPVGSYTITVTATSGSTTHTAHVSLAVK